MRLQSNVEYEEVVVPGGASEEDLKTSGKKGILAEFVEGTVNASDHSYLIRDETDDPASVRQQIVSELSVRKHRHTVKSKDLDRQYHTSRKDTPDLQNNSQPTV